MYTIIGTDGKEYGPVPVDRIRDWIAGGRANAATRIRRDSGEWTTIGALPEFADQVTAQQVPPPAARPAAATPLAAAAPDGREPKAIADEFIANAVELDVFSCLGRSFELWKNNFFPLVGVTLVVVLIMAAIGFVPIIGTIGSLLLTGVFYGGLYYFYLGLMRGEPREFGDAFAGFNRSLGPLMVAGLLVSLLSLAVAAVFLLPWAGFMIFAAKNSTPVNPLFIAGLCAGMLPVIYISVSWTMTFMLVIDKGLPAWTAMEVSRRVVTSQWFRVFFIVLLGGILSMLGLIAVVIGVLFTLPLMFGAILYAYEDLFNPPHR